MPTLRSIAPEIWGAEQDLRVAGMMHLPVRMTVIRQPDGTLLLHSPIAIDDALAGALAELGPVAHVVAPSSLHHLHFAAASGRYPNATRWGAPGLRTKRPDLTFDGILGEGAAPPWAATLQHLVLAGNPWLGEAVFFHPASGTLLVTDLLFNIRQARGWFTRLVLKMVGAYNKPAQSRMVRWTTKDRDALKTALQTMLQWPFDRIVPGHGEPLDSDARGVLLAQLQWILGAPALAAASASGHSG